MLRDLIYFDFEKGASLYSQIEGGLLTEKREGEEQAKDQRNIRKYDLKVFRPEFGGQSTDKTSQLEVRVLHHDLLGRLEDYLEDKGLLTELHGGGATSADPDSVRESLSESPYVRAEGWSVIEDYEKLSAISGQFNDLIAFIGRCGASSIESTPEYQALAEQLEAARRNAADQKNRNQRKVAERRLAKAEAELKKKIEEASGLGGVEEWLLSGVRLFIDVFMRDRILLRVYPDEGRPELQVLANLKRACFVDGDAETYLHSYGYRPNVKLTVLGLVTSLPLQEGHSFDPMAEFEAKADELTDQESFEQGFRRVFEGFDGMYRFVRYSRYPNLTVQPLAVYRSVRGASA